jgi:hypothetical protein
VKPGTRITWNGKGARITRPHPHVTDAYYCVIDGRGFEIVVRLKDIKQEKKDGSRTTL